MPGTLHVLGSNESSQQPDVVVAIIIPILQTRKLQHGGEVSCSVARSFEAVEPSFEPRQPDSMLLKH